MRAVLWVFVVCLCGCSVSYTPPATDSVRDDPPETIRLIGWLSKPGRCRSLETDQGRVILRGIPKEIAADPGGPGQRYWADVYQPEGVRPAGPCPGKVMAVLRMGRV